MTEKHCVITEKKNRVVLLVGCFFCFLNIPIEQASHLCKALITSREQTPNRESSITHYCLHLQCIGESLLDWQSRMTSSLQQSELCFMGTLWAPKHAQWKKHLCRYTLKSFICCDRNAKIEATLRVDLPLERYCVPSTRTVLCHISLLPFLTQQHLPILQRDC